MKCKGDIHLVLSTAEYMALMQTMDKNNTAYVPESEPEYWFDGEPYDANNNKIALKLDVSAAIRRRDVKRKVREVGLKAGLLKP